MFMRFHFVRGLLFLLGTTLSVWAQSAIVTPSDCVKVRYPATDGLNGIYGPLQASPDGSSIALIVRAPDLEKNRDQYSLYVEDLGPSRARALWEVLHADYIQHVTWLKDGRHLAVLDENGRSWSIVLVDVRTSKQRTVVRRPRPILEYAIDPMARVVVFTGNDDSKPRRRVAKKAKFDQNADGYRIQWNDQLQPEGGTQQVLSVAYREPNAKWSAPTRLNLVDHSLGSREGPLRSMTNLSVSPDGRQIEFSYFPDIVPDEWKRDVFVRSVTEVGGRIELAAVADIATGRMFTPIKAQLQGAPVVWSANSRSFLFVGAAPIYSTWEEEDIKAGRLVYEDVHLFSVDLKSGVVDQVAAQLPDDHESPLDWSQDGEVTVQLASGVIGRFSQKSGSWREVSRTSIPLKDFYRYDPIVSKAGRIFGVYEGISTPPDVYMFDSATNHLEFVTKLNPELKHLNLATAESISWQTADGYSFEGYLWKPAAYKAGVRYPLVIETKGNQGRFACDSGFNHDPAFEPQPIASAGMMYLTRSFPEGFHVGDEQRRYPKKYPGQIGEAGFQMEMWEAAVDSLVSKGLVDPDRIGIIGFSRTGWEVEFDLVHSHVHYAAATAVDNIQYSYGEYWTARSRGTMANYEQMLGGSPYGKTLQNWLDYSVSFNLRRIRTPLLMETMGYGVHDEIPGMIPSNLIGPSEIFTGLNRLKNPVEWYYYPDEEHQPVHPRARLASLERNLDWYRFWLQDYERPNPEDPDQYGRWEQMRTLQRGAVTVEEK